MDDRKPFFTWAKTEKTLLIEPLHICEKIFIGPLCRCLNNTSFWTIMYQDKDTPHWAVVLRQRDRALKKTVLIESFVDGGKTFLI